MVPQRALVMRTWRGGTWQCAHGKALLDPSVTCHCLPGPRLCSLLQASDRGMVSISYLTGVLVNEMVARKRHLVYRRSTSGYVKARYTFLVQYWPSASPAWYAPLEEMCRSL